MNNIKILIVCAVAVGITACVSTTPSAPGLKVGTFNVRLSSNGSWIADVNTPNAWEDRKEDFVKMFRDFDVDVWGLQEVCPDQLAYLSERLPEWTFVGDFRLADRKTGEAAPIAIRTSRFDIIVKGTFWLSETPDVPGSMSWDTAFPRTCSYALLKDRTTGRRFYFASTHLDHKSQEARKRGIDLIVRRLQNVDGGIPIVFTGDHNCVKESEPARLARGLLDDAADIAETPDPGPHRTYHNWGDEKVNVRIDYIYVSKGVRVLTYETRDDRRPGTDLYPSDHFPIIATLSLP